MDTDCDGTVHYINDAEIAPRGAIEDDHDKACREAARSADHYAEKEAEEARDWGTKSKAEADIEEARAEIHRGNTEALALIREIKQQRRPPFADTFTPAICAALRNQVTEYLRDRAAQFKIIKAREEDYWTAAPGY
jgi:rRNA maturation endonuclease Nob1